MDQSGGGDLLIMLPLIRCHFLPIHGKPIDVQVARRHDIQPKILVLDEGVGDPFVAAGDHDRETARGKRGSAGPGGKAGGDDCYRSDHGWYGRGKKRGREEPHRKDWRSPERWEAVSSAGPSRCQPG